MSVITVLPTSTTSTPQSPAFLVGQIYVRQNAATCVSLQQEHSSADGVSMLQLQPSGTRFHRISAHHPLVVDSLELSWKPISSHRPMKTFENCCWKAYYFTFTFICSQAHNEKWKFLPKGKDFDAPIWPLHRPLGLHRMLAKNWGGHPKFCIQYKIQYSDSKFCPTTGTKFWWGGATWPLLANLHNSWKHY